MPGAMRLGRDLMMMKIEAHCFSLFTLKKFSIAFADISGERHA